MFASKTAWFSHSCPDSVKQLWVDSEGTLEDVSLAQYVFSDDWQHNDTKTLYESEAYLRQHLAIFRSQYVTDAVHQGIANVFLGRYFLIPGPISDSISFRNLQTNVAIQNNGIASSSRSSVQQITSSENNSQEKNSDNSSIAIVSSSAETVLVETTGNTQQPVVSDAGQVIPDEVTDTGKGNTSNSQQLHKSKYRESNHIDKDTIPHIQSLPKVISCLRTIYPGKDGVEVKFFQ